MRLSFFFGSLVAACLAVGCSSSGGAASREDFMPTNDELNSTSNQMGLRLVFDDPTGHVHATVGTRMLPGEKLVMRVRRGRLSIGQQALLDCSQLADAPAMPVQQTYPKVVVYNGPELDRALLASVYSEQWIEQNLSADVIEHLSREGADAIVEACIVSSDQTPRVRLQTSLQDAWDGADPRVAPMLAAHNRSVPLPQGQQ